MTCFSFGVFFNIAFEMPCNSQVIRKAIYSVDFMSDSQKINNFNTRKKNSGFYSQKESVVLKPLSIHFTLSTYVHSFFDHFIKVGEMIDLLYFVLALISQPV